MILSETALAGVQAGDVVWHLGRYGDLTTYKLLQVKERQIVANRLLARGDWEKYATHFRSDDFHCFYRTESNALHAQLAWTLDMITAKRAEIARLDDVAERIHLAIFALEKAEAGV